MYILKTIYRTRLVKSSGDSLAASGRDRRPIPDSAGIGSYTSPYGCITVLLLSDWLTRG